MRWRVGVVVLAVLAALAALLLFWNAPRLDDPNPTAVTNMERFPSFLEYRGYYNVNPEEHRTETYDPREDAHNYHQSVAKLPELTPNEHNDVADTVYACLEKYGVPDVPPEGLRRFYRYAVQDNIGDRTIRLSLPHSGVLSLELVKRLQAEALKDHPLWRILIGAHRDEDVVLVYPNVIRVGSPADEKDLAAAISGVSRREVAAVDAREGPHRRQIEHFRAKAQASAPLPPKSYVILGVYDNFKGDFSETSIWFMHNGELLHSVSLEPEDVISMGDNFTADAAGRFSPTLEWDPNAPYRIEQQLIPKKDLDMDLFIFNEMDGTRTPLSLSLADLITDEELKRSGK